jgi:hypothetical protein
VQHLERPRRLKREQAEQQDAADNRDLLLARRLRLDRIGLLRHYGFAPVVLEPLAEELEGVVVAGVVAPEVDEPDAGAAALCVGATADGEPVP